MNETQGLREAVTGLVAAAADLLRALAERKRRCEHCSSHVCWHYYPQATTMAAAPVYPYTVTYNSSRTMGTG